MDNELIKLITIIAIPTVTIVVSNMALFLHLSKKIDNLSDRVTKLEIEIKGELSKLNSKFDLFDERYKSTNEKVENLTTQVAEIKTGTSTRFNQIETENKNYIKELMNKVLEVFPKSAL